MWENKFFLKIPENLISTCFIHFNKDIKKLTGYFTFQIFIYLQPEVDLDASSFEFCRSYDHIICNQSLKYQICTPSGC